MPNPFYFVPRWEGGILRHSRAMRAPYGLEIIENCVTCPVRQDRLFCELSAPATASLSAITSPSTYPKGAALFVEDQPARGVFILCRGRVKLSTSSADGRSLIARIADAGEVLGMPATLTGKPYELTAEVIEPAQVNFIPKADFIGFLREHGDAALRVAQQLGEIYQSAVAEMRNVGLSQSAAEKLARFLLELAPHDGEPGGEVKVTLTLTHEEIAQIIGASRETVTRLFGDFKKRQLIEVRGSSLVLKDRARLLDQR